MDEWVKPMQHYKAIILQLKLKKLYFNLKNRVGESEVVLNNP